MQYELYFLSNSSSPWFTVLCRLWILKRILWMTKEAIVDGGSCFWSWTNAFYFSDVLHLSYFCYFFLFKAKMWSSVSGLSLDSSCPQAIINYRHVFAVHTPPSLPLLCDTGHIIIFTSDKNASAILLSEEFLLLPSVSQLCQGSLSTLNAQTTQKSDACDECAAVFFFFVPCKEEERMRTCEDLLGADWHRKAGWNGLFCERSRCLISLTWYKSPLLTWVKWHR